MTILSAIQRLQVLALASDADMKIAPDTPIEDASALPMSIAHLAEGEGTASNSTTLRFEPVINVDFHFNRTWLKQAYTQIDNVALAYMARLAGDPTLAGAVDTIQFPVSFTVGAVEYDKVTTMMLRFSVPVKTLETPIST